MTDELVDGIYLVRAFDLIEPFAERLQEADRRDEGQPVPDYEPLVDALTDHSGRVEAISRTYPNSPYRDDLRTLASDIRALPANHPTREGVDERLREIAGQLELLADDTDAVPEDFEAVLDDFESLIVIVDTLHEGYSHLVRKTDLTFADG